MNYESNFINIIYDENINNKYYIKNDETKIIRNIINDYANNKYYNCWTTDSETDDILSYEDSDKYNNMF